MTKADRIRQMTDDEELLYEIGFSCYRCVYNGECICLGSCADGNLKWLKQEVQDQEVQDARSD